MTRSPSWRSTTERILIHHTVTPFDASPEDITRMHLARKFWTIGYNGLVWKSPSGWRFDIGRGLDAVGAHCAEGGQNYRAIGVAITGNWSSDERDMPSSGREPWTVIPDGWHVLVRSVAALCHLYGLEPGPQTIQAHQRYQSTACCGFDVGRLAQDVRTFSGGLALTPRSGYCTDVPRVFRRRPVGTVSPPVIRSLKSTRSGQNLTT